MKRKNLKKLDTKFTHWRKRQLENCRLYCILDIEKSPTQITNLVTKISSAGVDIIQLREKGEKFRKLLAVARILKSKLKVSQVLIIINDRADIAKLSGADGVHLGQADISPKDARAILGPKKIIGISCHSKFEAVKAQNDGADYLAIGPIFPTPTKVKVPAIGLKILTQLSPKIKIPIFAIGGINYSNISKIKKKGLNRIAVYRAITKAKNPSKISARLKQSLLGN